MVGQPRSTTTRDRYRSAIARTKPPCGICGKPIDYALKSPHPESFEVDHIVALDNGGPDTLDNAQASHRHCNRAKWNKNTTKTREFVTWRTW